MKIQDDYIFDPRIPFICIPDGLVTGKRELISKKDEVWAWQLAVQGRGESFEVRTKNQAVFDSIPLNEAGRFLCHTETWQGRKTLILADYQPRENAEHPILMISPAVTKDLSTSEPVEGEVEPKAGAGKGKNVQPRARNIPGERAG